MKATLARMLAVSMLLVALGAAPAEAHTRTASTSLSISASDTRVDSGDSVRFSGKLKSGWKKCKKRQTVTLYRGSRAIKSTTTRRSGAYAFTKRVRNTARFRVRYAGRSFGVHPHVHRCLESQSRRIRVRVR